MQDLTAKELMIIKTALITQEREYYKAIANVDSDTLKTDKNYKRVFDKLEDIDALLSRVQAMYMLAGIEQ